MLRRMEARPRASPEADHSSTFSVLALLSRRSRNGIGLKLVTFRRRERESEDVERPLSREFPGIRRRPRGVVCGACDRPVRGTFGVGGVRRARLFPEDTEMGEVCFSLGGLDICSNEK